MGGGGGGGGGWSPTMPKFDGGGFLGFPSGGGGGGGGGLGIKNMGRPERPEFQSILGSDGNLQDPFKGHVNTMSARMISEDMSPWKSLQHSALDARGAALQDQAGNAANQARGQAWSDLAGAGGLDSGARERVASASALNRMNTMQGINRDINQGKLETDIAGHQMSLDAQRFNTGSQNAANQWNADALNRMSVFNAQNAIGGVGMQNAFNSNVYNQDMGAWGANQTANAMARSANRGGGGPFSFFSNIFGG